MDAILAVVLGIVVGTGVYLMLQRRLLQVVLGVALLSHAANMVVFLASGLSGLLDGANLPIVPAGQTALEAPHADPVPQAFVLTAIVIGFGVMAFLIALAWRTYVELRTDDLSALWRPEKEKLDLWDDPASR